MGALDMDATIRLRHSDRACWVLNTYLTPRLGHAAQAYKVLGTHLAPSLGRVAQAQKGVRRGPNI